MDERRIARIREMETALNEWTDLGNKGEELLEEMTTHLPSLERLVAYYSSPDWMRDHDASDEGLLPPDLPHGVLSEDALGVAHYPRLYSTQTTTLRKLCSSTPSIP